MKPWPAVVCVDSAPGDVGGSGCMSRAGEGEGRRTAGQRRSPPHEAARLRLVANPCCGSWIRGTLWKLFPLLRIVLRQNTP